MLRAKLSKAADWLRRRRLKVRLSRPVVAMLSDDWGADHVGFYGRESPDDLRRLADVLAAHRDSAGHPTVLSPNMVTMKPDFPTLERNGFSDYAAVDTYADRPELTAAWKEGVERGVFAPQFHGRDHLNVDMWLDELRAGQADFLRAFRHRKVLFKSPNWAELVAEKPCRAMIAREFIDCRRNPSVPIAPQVQAERVRQGVEAFERQFGFRPRCAVASGGAFDSGTEAAWAAAGIEYCHAPGYHRVRMTAEGRFELRPRYYGEKNGAGLRILVGNGEYEPGKKESTEAGARAASDQTFAVVSRALSRREPVFIATHAQNYYGDSRKTAANLAGLDALLGRLRESFPDLLFAATCELGDLIYGRGSIPERLKEVEVTSGLTPGLLLKEAQHSLLHRAPTSEDE